VKGAGVAEIQRTIVEACRFFYVGYHGGELIKEFYSVLQAGGEGMTR